MASTKLKQMARQARMEAAVARDEAEARRKLIAKVESKYSSKIVEGMPAGLPYYGLLFRDILVGLACFEVLGASESFVPVPLSQYINGVSAVENFGFEPPAGGPLEPIRFMVFASGVGRDFFWKYEKGRKFQVVENDGSEGFAFYVRIPIHELKEF
jgi:hypothetical protein